MPTLSPKTTPYYGGGQVNNPADVIRTTGVPSSQLTQHAPGTIAIDNVAAEAYMLVSKAGGVDTWEGIGGGTISLNQLTGNTGGALNPTAGNINILGSRALSFAGSGSTLTGSITPGTDLVATIAGNSGGALSPTAGAMSIVGSGALAFAGAGSTLTGSITPGTALVSTLTGGSGGALSPTAGNLSILGTANEITSTGAGSTITLSLPAAITTPGSLTATTTLTATLGAITATNGNLVLNTAGNKINVAVGANASAGVSGAMTLGVVTVATTAVTANSLVFVQPAVLGTVTAPQAGYVDNIVAGTSFRINSADLTDTSVWNWWLIN